MTQIKNSSLVWSTEDVHAAMSDEMRNSKEFFETHADWIGERINEAMSEFLYFEVKQ